jgi:periplasmic divalent cation tolerance protein
LKSSAVKLGCSTKTFLGPRMPPIIVFSTCGSEKEARKISRDIVQEKLAACANIMPVTSCYRWKRKIVTEREYLMIIKSRSEVFARLKGRILALHSYELPEIVSVKIDAGFSPYLKWIGQEVPGTR